MLFGCSQSGCHLPYPWKSVLVSSWCMLYFPSFFLNSTTHLTEETAHVTFLSPLKAFPKKNSRRNFKNSTAPHDSSSPRFPDKRKTCLIQTWIKGPHIPKIISKHSAEDFVRNRISIYCSWFEPTKWVESEYFALLDFGFFDVLPSQFFLDFNSL